MKKTLLLLTTVSALVLGGCMGDKKEAQPTPTETKAPAIASLCKASEKVLFNCMIASEGKMLSVCASNNLTASTGYLQYRYGANANALDLNHPRSIDKSQAAFRLSGGVLSFQNGSITYQVDSSGVKTLWPKAPERNKTLACSGTTNDLNSLNGIVQ